MRFSTSLFLSLSTLLVATSAQTHSTTHVESVDCLAFPRAILPERGAQGFLPEAITGLSQSLANNSFATPLPADGIKLSPGEARSVKWGTSVKDGYQVCVQNFYFFKSLTVPLDAISDTVAQIRDTCCKPEMVNNVTGRLGQCQDSKAILTLADGSEMVVVGQDFNDNCCGMWGCGRS